MGKSRVYSAKYVEKVQRIIDMVDNMISLDTPLVNSDGDLELLQNKIADTRVNIEEDVLLESRNNILYKALSTLDPSEIKVLSMHYGLYNYPRMTLSEVGRCYGVSRQCVQQIESKGLLKLKQYLESIDCCKLTDL